MKLNLPNLHASSLQALVGVNDRNLMIFKTYLGYRMTIMNQEVVTDAPESMRTFLESVFHILITLAEHQVPLNERDVMYVIKGVEAKQEEKLLTLYLDRKKIMLNDQGKAIYPKTVNQLAYVESIDSHDLIFGVGPAGTGKTYLAVAMAAALLRQKVVRKIVLTRPAIEAGESLGYLPGDLKEKVDPYLIPLYDALYDILGKSQTDLLIEKEVIEIAPLAYMRGRTLENACIIVDEAQNTTTTQMKMILTRLGFSSKMIITGDPSQVDLPKGKASGLNQALQLLEGLDEVGMVYFKRVDVVRHPLVQHILERYEAYENTPI